MSRGPDAGVRLERRLAESAAAAGWAMRIVEADWTRWASATFSGARHRIEVDGPASPAASAWLDALPDADLPIAGHLVADLVIARRARIGDAIAARIEVLTVESV